VTSVQALGWWLADPPAHNRSTRALRAEQATARRRNQPQTPVSLQALWHTEDYPPKGACKGGGEGHLRGDPWRDPLPAGLLPDLRGAGVDPENFRWFDLESVKEEEEKEEQQALRFGDLDEEPLDEETAKRIWREIRKDIRLEDTGEEKPRR
jgi:hypothetical protein